MTNEEVLFSTLKDLFDRAESLGAGKLELKLYREPEDFMPFKAVVVLVDEPVVNQRYLDALGGVEASIRKEEQ